MVEKIVLPDRPISPMHSLTSFIEYLSVCVCSFSARKSWNKSKTSVFLGDDKDGTVELASGWLHHT